MVVSNGSDKSCLFLVVSGQWYLMISLKDIQEAHPRMAYGCIYQLIYPRHRERIFWVGFIQIREVYETRHFPLFFFTTIVLANHSVGLSTRTRKPTHPFKPTGPTRKPTDPMPVMVGGGSSPQRTDSGGSDDEFSSPKPDEPDPTAESRERRPNLPRSGEDLVVFG